MIRRTPLACCISNGVSQFNVFFLSMYGAWQGVEIKEKAYNRKYLKELTMMKPLKNYCKFQLRKNSLF